MEKRLFVVSNRLPLTVCEKKGLQPASGGLVSAVNSYLLHDSSDFTDVFWCGVPGCRISTWMAGVENQEASVFTYLPVFPHPVDYEGYYNGHANSVLWPLFHYFPSYAEYNVKTYEQYQTVNALFADTLLNHCIQVIRCGYTTIICCHSLPCYEKNNRN
jgi:trehalose 6-phosphate synthase/phosphatase